MQRKWKLIGLAGVAGVAVAAGAATASARKRRATVPTEPEELRARLHQRLATAEADGSSSRSHE